MENSGYMALAIASLPVVGGIVVAVISYIEKRRAKQNDGKSTKLTLEQQQQLEFHKSLLAEVLESRKTIAQLQAKLLEVSQKSFMSEAENLIESSIVTDLKKQLEKSERVIGKVREQREIYRRALAKLQNGDCTSLDEVSDDIKLADEANSER